MKILIWIIKLVFSPIHLLISVCKVLPPYKVIQGRLLDKSKSADGDCHILVGQELIVVDEMTLNTLVIGEALKLRLTRDNRAIEIKRLVP